MASFTEQATLKLVDQSTPQINKINAALKKLFATANSLKSKRIDLAINDKGLTKASADIRRLTADLGKLKSQSVNLKVNTSGISQASRQLNQLRTQATRPITANLRGAFAGSGGVALHAAGRAAREGTRTVDIGETSLALKELPKEVGDAVQTAINDISKQQSIFNRGTITAQVSEMLGVVKIGAAENAADAAKRVTTAKFLAQQNLGLAETFVKLGMDVEHAQEEAVKFGKAMDMQSKIYDKATGDLNVPEATKQYDMIRKLIPSIGKEATGSNFLQLMKYLRVSKFGLSEESTALAMSEFEKMGTGAAVGLNQMIKALRGETTKAGIAEQIRLGLLQPGEATSGTSGGKTTTTRTGVLDEARSRKLYENPQAFVNEDLIPAWKKDLMARKKLTDAQAEDELNKPSVVADLVSKLGGTATSRDMLTSLVLQRKENAQFLKDFRSRSGSLDEQRQRTAYSIVGATTAISQQVQGAFGEAARAIAPVMVPAMNTISQAISDMAPTIRAAAEGDTVAQTKVVTGALAAGFAAKVASPMTQAVTQAFSAVATPLGTAAGIAAMTDQNPAIRSLGSAGVSLLGAAGALKEAAGALGNSVGIPGIGGGPGGPNDQSKKPPKPISEEMKDRVNRIRFGGITPAGRLGSVVRTAITQLNQAQPKLEEVSEADRQLAKAKNDLAKAIQDRSDYEKFVANQGKKKGAYKTPEPLRNAFRAEQDAIIEHYRRRLAELESDRMGPPRKMPAKPFSETLGNIGDKIARPLERVVKSPAFRQVGKQPPLMDVPMPMADPRKAGGIPATPAASIELLTRSNESFANSALQLSTGVGEAKSVFEGAPARFNEAFGTIPGRMSEGGSSAGSAIASAMVGAAGEAGSIIAGKISAAAANVQINVNTTNNKPDTGGINYANGNK